MARQVIEKSQIIGNLSTEKVKYNLDETNHCLDERIQEVEFYKQELVRIRNELPPEIDTLEWYKTRLVNSLAALKLNSLSIFAINV